jgi:hypothetical protein
MVHLNGAGCLSCRVSSLTRFFGSHEWYAQDHTGNEFHGRFNDIAIIIESLRDVKDGQDRRDRNEEHGCRDMLPGAYSMKGRQSDAALRSKKWGLPSSEAEGGSRLDDVWIQSSISR